MHILLFQSVFIRWTVCKMHAKCMIIKCKSCLLPYQISVCYKFTHPLGSPQALAHVIVVTLFVCVTTPDSSEMFHQIYRTRSPPPDPSAPPPLLSCPIAHNCFDMWQCQERLKGGGGGGGSGGGGSGGGGGWVAVGDLPLVPSAVTPRLSRLCAESLAVP